MANIRNIRNQRKAIRHIRSVTRTMEMIAVVQFRRVRQHDLAARPAGEQWPRILQQLAPGLAGVEHPFLRGGTGNRAAVVVVTSDRGLCAGYNHRVMALARQAIDRLVEEGRDVLPYVIGRKALQEFRSGAAGPGARSRGLPEPDRSYGGLTDRGLDEQVRAMAEELMGRVRDGELSAAYVAYTRLSCPGGPKPEVVTLLPIVPEAGPTEPEGEPIEYEMLPSVQAVAESLVPMVVRLKLYECFLEALASEHSVRMTTMRTATENADEMISTLALEINRTRRGRITTELAEIMSGADALR